MRFVPVLALVLLATSARATLTISNDATRNVTCSAGSCSATDSDAVLNVDELEDLLAQGDLTVSGDHATSTVRLAVPLRWANRSTLTLDSSDLIEFDAPLTVEGRGGVALVTAKLPRFVARGRIRFTGPGGRFSIDGVRYKLVHSIAELAEEANAHRRAFLALADSYDAAGDGTYAHPPVTSGFAGAFEGLGNRIVHFSLDDVSDPEVGLFAELHLGAGVENLGMAHARIRGSGALAQSIGVIAGFSRATISHCYASGSIKSRGTIVGGGLVGESRGTILRSFAEVAVSGGPNSQIGGLAGSQRHRAISDSYALGAVEGGQMSTVGGLVGLSKIDVLRSYAAGPVAGRGRSVVGGLLGTNDGSAGAAYWDTTTSGTDTGVGSGATSGVTGLSDDELKSALPAGFDPSVWGQAPEINGGLPYLLDNPPR